MTKIITLTDLIKSRKITAKTARRKLRSLGRSVPKTIDNKHWAWTTSDAAKVRTLLSK